VTPITWTGGPTRYDGINANYWRLASEQTATPPFTFHGTIRLNAVMDPPVFGPDSWKHGQTASYSPGLNWHPLYPSNSHNIVVGVGRVRDTQPEKVGISAEIDNVYGVRTGYEYRVRHDLPTNPIDSQWHAFRWEVESNSHYRLYWDGLMVCDVQELEPATIPPGPVPVGLRLDFCDVDLGSMYLEEGAAMYPNGYGTQMVTLAEMQAKHGPKMHPEFRRRFFAWIESMGGLLGVGGGWRDTQPDKPGFAPDGKSFHQYQHFASGLRAYCAVDLVARNGSNVHRAPTWGESETAPDYGLHTFITGEPWHIQPIEIRGWQTWVDNGRRDPVAGVTLPGEIPEEDDDMPLFAAKSNSGVIHIVDGVWRYAPADAAVVLNMHHGVGKPVLDFATGRPVTSPDDVTRVDDALIQSVAFNVRSADDDNDAR